MFIDKIIYFFLGFSVMSVGLAPSLGASEEVSLGRETRLGHPHLSLPGDWKPQRLHSKLFRTMTLPHKSAAKTLKAQLRDAPQAHKKEIHRRLGVVFAQASGYQTSRQIEDRFLRESICHLLQFAEGSDRETNIQIGHLLNTICGGIDPAQPSSILPPDETLKAAQSIAWDWISRYGVEEDTQTWEDVESSTETAVEEGEATVYSAAQSVESSPPYDVADGDAALMPEVAQKPLSGGSSGPSAQHSDSGSSASQMTSIPSDLPTSVALPSAESDLENLPPSEDEYPPETES